MRIKIALILILFLASVNSALAYDACGSPVEGSPKDFLNIPLNSEQVFADYHITYTGNDGDYSITYYISGNEYTPANYYTVYSADIDGNLYWNPIFSLDENGDLISEIETDSLNVGSSQVSFHIHAYTCAEPTPTPTTPAPTTPLPTIPTETPTATATATGGGIGNYTEYDPSDVNGTYSHIPKESSGFNDLLKGAGYCKSGTCTGGDIMSFIASYISILWWSGLVCVILRFWTLKPKKTGGR